MAKKAKKAKAKQLHLVAKPEGKGVKAPPQVTLVSFTVTAVIPTQEYGNIQPRIEVTATNIDEARAFVMPIINDLYKTYTSSKPAFLGKIEVTEKIVNVGSPAAQTAPAVAPAHQAVPRGLAPQTGASAPGTTVTNQKPKTEAVLKAEKAIGLALTEEAMLVIQTQIEKSTKIADEDKPELLKMCLKRRGELDK